jgi:hypothetical protein
LNPLFSQVGNPNNSPGSDSPQEESNMRPITPTAPIQVPGFDLTENQWIKEMFEEHHVPLSNIPASIDSKAWKADRTKRGGDFEKQETAN